MGSGTALIGIKSILSNLTQVSTTESANQRNPGATFFCEYFYIHTICLMHLRWRQEREERQNKGKVQYVTKDVSWLHTSSVVSACYVCWPTPVSRAATGSLDLWFVFLLEQRGWEELSCSENKIRGEEVSGVGQIKLSSQTDSCLPKTSLLNIPPTWKTGFITLSCVHWSAAYRNSLNYHK